MIEPSKTTGTTVIRTSMITKHYGSIIAVDHLDFSINEGEIYGLIGPNGAGKTTLIKMLVGILKPDSGTAEVLDKPPFDRGIKYKTGYMPQEIAIYDDLTVRENLRFFGEVYGLSKNGIEARIQEIIDLVDLNLKADTVVMDLSGGMRHRLSLGCSIIHDPQILFLDEPTVGVDPELRVSFWSYFKTLAKIGKTILISTHYLDEAMNCTRVGMMHHGKIIADGVPHALMKAANCVSLEEAFLYYSRTAKQMEKEAGK